MSRIFPLLLFCVSIFIAGNAAYFSVKGIGLLFAGSFLPVIVMASSLELGKLFAVSFLYRKWHDMRWMYRLYLTLSCGVLIFITSLGIFGFLSDAYQDTKTKVDNYESKIVSLTQQNMDLKQKIDTLKTSGRDTTTTSTESIDKYKKIYDEYVIQTNNKINLLRGEINKMDQQMNQLKSKSGGLFSNSKKKIEALTTEQQPMRVSLTDQIESLEKSQQEEYNKFVSKVDTLSDNKQTIKDTSDVVANTYEQIKQNSDLISQYKTDIGNTDIGSFRFIAESFNIPVDQAVKWFIIIIVVVFDPLAICLILAYNMMVTPKRIDMTPVIQQPLMHPGTKIVPVRKDKASAEVSETKDGKRLIMFGKKKQ